MQHQDEILWLWAEWGVLGKLEYEHVIKKYGSLIAAWNRITVRDLREWEFSEEKVGRCMAVREALSFPDIQKRVMRANIKLLTLFWILICFSV